MFKKNYSRSGAAAQRNFVTSFVASWRRCVKNFFLASLTALLLLSSTGCIVVGGYSSGRGWFIWPGSIVFILIGLALFLLMIFRRRG